MSGQPDPLNMIICGVGGQGNILLSRMIGRVLMGKGYRVSIGETFGAAQRGGSVFSTLRISRGRDHGPLVPDGRGHVIMGLEPLELLRMLKTFGNPDVVTLFNTQPVYPVGVLAKRYGYPDLEKLKAAIGTLSRKSWSLNATQRALDLKAPIVANMIMLGALAASAAIPVNMEDVTAEVKNSFPPDKIDLNLKALDLGRDSIATGG
jgi:indolepyruvate ferredoxin oxidoreductase beta subunit